MLGKGSGVELGVPSPWCTHILHLPCSSSSSGSRDRRAGVIGLGAAAIVTGCYRWKVSERVNPLTSFLLPPQNQFLACHLLFLPLTPSPVAANLWLPCPVSADCCLCTTTTEGAELASSTLVQMTSHSDIAEVTATNHRK